jgi:prophage regulatory protein
MSQRVQRLPEVKATTGLSRSTIYEAMSRGDFPKPIRLGLRAVGWDADEITAWLESRKAQREAA